ncbi:hypothetical protein MPSEU_000697200 [Mayamaea pseudoterrestris]|nr:hypothetical protein MPSEU_000697200 [Mayamaea pseudoterrestris]
MMRELKVEDALLYLDQVKVEFGDQPHIYNAFLDIMKTFKTQQIDTPGVIRRVSDLFQGNPRLVLGFNTFLPEGYKIELPDGDGPAIAVYRAPGSNVTHVLTEGVPHHPAPPLPQQQQQLAPPMAASQLQRPQPARQYSSVMLPQSHARPNLPPMQQQPPMDHQQAAQQKIAAIAQPPPPPAAAGPPPAAAHDVSGGSPPAAAASTRNYEEQQQQQQQQGSPQQGPLEFDHAISYVTTIKKRFAHEPYTYKKFLEILHTYQKEQRGIKEVLDEVSALFADHPDLLKEFTYFLPDTVQAQAKTQLDAAAKEAEERKRLRQAKASRAGPSPVQAQQHFREDAMMRDANQPRSSPPEYDRTAPPPQPFTQHGRTPEQEHEIIRSARYGIVSFAPIKPPRKNELAPAQAVMKKGRPATIPEQPYVPNTLELAFFQRAKAHFQRRELQPEKPSSNKRHTPFTEFLKCLHLFGAGILSKEELLPLLKSLLMHGHAPKTTAANVSPAIVREGNELLRDFEELLRGRGPFAGQETYMKDKSKYGGLRTRDFDLDSCEHPTPSYWTYPSDYPQNLFLSNTAQSDEDRSVLNNAVFIFGQKVDDNKSINSSLASYDASRARRNAYEETLFRIEDERFEVDMAIERNFQAMRQIEPLAEEVQALREQEEKDRQPIGRLQYQLNRHALNTIHINAVGRLYGDKGDEVLQHLAENPYIVLPIVFQRLKQKDAEWRSIKNELQAGWAALQAANYEGSLDLLCGANRRELERRFSTAMLEDECKRARTYCRYPERVKHSSITDPFYPTFAMSCSDPGALLYQPYSIVSCAIDATHKDAMRLIMDFVGLNHKIKAFDRERIGRIWAEFMVPWFGYPVQWVAEEVRKSFGGKMSPGIVKFVAGQRVMTIFGEGFILTFQDSQGGVNGPKYRVKLPFATAYLSPSAILFAIAVKDQPYVRRDGVMAREESFLNRSPTSASQKLDPRYKLLFGTDNIYLFIRQYTLVCSVLASTRLHQESLNDPPIKYSNSVRKTSTPDITPTKVDYATVFSALRKVLLKKMDSRDFESLARRLTKTHVHEFAALPKLIERCAETLILTAKEDCLLHLYDYCKYSQADPVVVRTRCFAVASEAAYRIQYDLKAKALYFNYLPKSVDLLSVPRHDDDRIEDYDGQDSADIPMEVDDPIQDADDSEDRPNKRLRVD